jgi:PAS domain S-box-containing protein
MALHPAEEAPLDWDPIRRELDKNPRWYRDLVEHSRNLLCAHDLEGRFLSVNPNAARLLGYSLDEMLRKPMRDFLDPQFRPLFDTYLEEIKRKGVCHGLMAVLTRSGEQRIWEYHNTLRTQDMTKPIVRGIAHDVTDRMRAEQALSSVNERLLRTALDQQEALRRLTLFRTLVDESNDVILVIDPDTMRFLDINERASVALGYSREELLSMSVFDIDPDADENVQERVKQESRKAGFATFEREHRRKDGTSFPVEVNLRIVQLDREYCVAIARDITERKRAEERLREFERVVENVEEMIVVVDRDYRYVIANRAFLRYRGLTIEQVSGRLIAEILNPGVFESVVKEKLDESFRGKVVNYEFRYRYPELGERDLTITYLPIEGPKGIDRVACVLRDITERKRTEEAVLASEARERARAKELATVLDAVPVPVYISHDRACRRITGNRAAYEQLQVPVGSNFSKSAPPEELPKFRLLQNGVEMPVDSLPMQLVASTGKPIYGSAWTKEFEDGTAREELINAVPLLGDDGEVRGAVAAAVDVTELIKAENALRQSEERFRVALKHSPIAVFNQDRDLRYTWMYNPHVPGAAQGHVGQTPVEFFGPEEGERIEAVRRRVLETGVGARHEVVLTEAGKKHYFDTTIEPLFDASGAVIGITGASMDVTELRETSEALREAKRRLTEEKLYLEKEIDTELGFGEIVGQSKALQAVMEQVRKVASSNATVLLLGETGTGKELVARAIHRLSQRRHNTFIKMNCAAIPSGLLESELFGNEKGAFTGAVSKKVGRLELADKGTLFLDEIGEIELSLQPKLLRVLQDQEFERLGGNHTLKVDFRLIAATNSDLAARVRDNEFRSDLFYRLNVFPIRVPPLRERREDIRLLVEHFVQKCARRMNKSITSIPKKTMESLMAWEWPGNVRELENFVERSVILTEGSVLVAPLNVLERSTKEDVIPDQTLQTTEREYILRALRESHWQIGGPRGAAVRLGLKRTTLQSKMKLLGINNRSPRSAH